MYKAGNGTTRWKTSVVTKGAGEICMKNPQLKSVYEQLLAEGDLAKVEKANIAYKMMNMRGIEMSADNLLANIYM